MNIEEQIKDLKVKFGHMVRDDRLYHVIKSIIKHREREAVRDFLSDFTITAIYEDCNSNDEVMKRWDSLPEKEKPEFKPTTNGKGEE